MLGELRGVISHQLGASCRIKIWADSECDFMLLIVHCALIILIFTILMRFACCGIKIKIDNKVDSDFMLSARIRFSISVGVISGYDGSESWLFSCIKVY